ncbi:MAG: hypothetical protein NT161_01070 [Candidatus Nomurabacteria bacterium]|nr:hypothetical protein [Candidatus Nomurabacteria bacterium]
MDENKLKNKNVETYTADMVKAIESDKGGLIKKIIHEEEEHEAEKVNLSPGSKKNRTFMFIGMVLVFLALVVLVFLAFFNNKINTVPVVPQASSIIFTDQTDFTPIDGLTKEKIAETISNEANNTKVKIGGVGGIYLTENKKVVGFSRFSTLIKNSLTASQIGLINDNFLLGTFKSGLSSISPNIGDLFILLKVKSFSDIFPVMQSWESKMLYDLHGFFGVKLSPETNYLFTKNFEDGIVANKNARILKDNDGQIILMYVFADDNSIILTKSENAVSELILRLNSSQIKK